MTPEWLDQFHVDSTTPFGRDRDCRHLIKLHPDGMTLLEIGATLFPRVCRERVRQIEGKALRVLQLRRRILAAIETKKNASLDEIALEVIGRNDHAAISALTQHLAALRKVF